MYFSDLWIEQCDATEEIQERYGLQDGGGTEAREQPPGWGARQWGCDGWGRKGARHWARFESTWQNTRHHATM